MPGMLFNDLIHKPESSEITGYFTNLEKKFTFNFEFPLNDLLVSFGLGILREIGEIFLYFFESK